MAEEKGSGGGPMEMVWLLGAIIGGLILLWWVNGGPERADLRGIFLNPLPPVGSGDAYGPQFGTTTNED